MDDYKLAKISANWWIQEIKKLCSHKYPQKVINTNSNFVIIDSSLANDLSRFETVLTNEILCCIQQRSYLCLTCCFIPGRELSKIARKAQISTDYLPHRATMQICGNSVEVSLDGEDLRMLPMSVS